MPSWNKLFLRNENIKLFPQTEIYRFIKKLENTFSSLPLRIWDHCCGAGRHSILITQMGHQAFSSDISENGIEYLKQWLQNEKLNGEVKLSNMCLNPWHDSFFHGVISWDAIYHNKIAEIEKAIESIRRSLVKGGMFIATLMSTKSLSGDDGEEVEKNTFLNDRGDDSGVLHHYFDKNEIVRIFKNWEPVILAEQVVAYLNVENEFWKSNPFPYTKWLVLMKK